RFPTRSLTSIRPSGRGATSHGRRRPDCNVATVSRGVAPPVTVTATKTPSSSIQTVPSMTGRSARTYVLGVVGALTRNVNVAFAPGATLSSVCAAGGEPLSQLTPGDAHVSSSFLIPRRASCPRTPLTHGLPPVLRNVNVIGSLVAPGARSGALD